MDTITSVDLAAVKRNDMDAIRTKKLRRDVYRSMTKDQLETHIQHLMFEAAQIFETLEGLGIIRGNGHHARMSYAESAVADLRDRWIDKTDDGE